MFLTVTMFALATTASTTPSADEFFDSLMQMPVVLEDVAAVVDLSDGVDLELSYNLARVGNVSIAVHGDDDGAGHGEVLLGAKVVAEFELAGDAVVWERVDFSGFRPDQVEAVAASVAQVWHENQVEDALAATIVEPLEARDFKCSVAGAIAGATAGILVGGSCGILLKHPGCSKAAGTAYGYASFYITNKCNAGQNT